MPSLSRNSGVLDATGHWSEGNCSMSGPGSISRDSRSQHSVPLKLAEGRGQVLYSPNLSFSIRKMGVFVLTIKLRCLLEALSTGPETQECSPLGPPCAPLGSTSPATLGPAPSPQFQGEL